MDSMNASFDIPAVDDKITKRWLEKRDVLTGNTLNMSHFEGLARSSNATERSECYPSKPRYFARLQSAARTTLLTGGCRESAIDNAGVW